MRTDRLVSIIMLLLERDSMSAQALADRFEVSPRTIYRDLEAISMAGIPVRAVSGVNGGIEIMREFKLDKRYFTAAELTALLHGLSSLSGMLRSDALANALENKLVESILASVPHTHDDEALHQTDALTRELFQAFVQNQRAVNILFSGNRQGIFANSIEKGLRQRFEEADPTFAADLNRGILLSFCVQGCFYAFTNNSGRMDESKLVALLGAIAKAAQKIEL